VFVRLEAVVCLREPPGVVAVVAFLAGGEVNYQSTIDLVFARVDADMARAHMSVTVASLSFGTKSLPD
jgi:hypothetical protein